MATQESFTVSTLGRNTIELTSQVERIVQNSGIETGLCHVFTHHTSASLIFCENADPDVQRDLGVFMSGLVTDGAPRFIHTLEGEDDMPAHIRTTLTDTNLSAPISNGQLALGTWQGIFLWEHRYSPQNRKITVTLLN